jgi:hypothetical protein
VNDALPCALTESTQVRDSGIGDISLVARFMELGSLTKSDP